nr:unnamed protein product [Callosobruchus analis]
MVEDMVNQYPTSIMNILANTVQVALGSCNGSFDIFLEVFERLGREVSARFINYKTIWAGDFNINLAPSSYVNLRFYKLQCAQLIEEEVTENEE